MVHGQGRRPELRLQRHAQVVGERGLQQPVPHAEHRRGQQQPPSAAREDHQHIPDPAEPEPGAEGNEPAPPVDGIEEVPAQDARAREHRQDHRGHGGVAEPVIEDDPRHLRDDGVEEDHVRRKERAPAHHVSGQHLPELQLLPRLLRPLLRFRQTQEHDEQHRQHREIREKRHPPAVVAEVPAQQLEDDRAHVGGHGVPAQLLRHVVPGEEVQNQRAGQRRDEPRAHAQYGPAQKDLGDAFGEHGQQSPQERNDQPDGGQRPEPYLASGDHAGEYGAGDRRQAGQRGDGRDGRGRRIRKALGDGRQGRRRGGGGQGDERHGQDR